MTVPDTSPPAALVPQAEPEARLGELVGDRLCSKCFFNLSGQTIVRERHYQLLIVRCPECGTAAPLQEYPLLGRWSNRLGYLCAAAYVLNLLAILGIASLTNFGFAMSFYESLQYSSYGRFNLEIAFVVNAIPGFLILGSVGIYLAVTAPSLRGLKLLIWPGIVFVLSFFFAMFVFGINSFRFGGSDRSLWFLLTIVYLVFGALCVLAGSAIGRPLARLFVTLMLPPRLRGPLAYLWRVDNRPIPKLKA